MIFDIELFTFISAVGLVWRNESMLSLSLMTDYDRLTTCSYVIYIYSTSH